MRPFGRELPQPLVQVLAEPDGPATDVAGRWPLLAEERRADVAVAGRRVGAERSRQVLLVGAALHCHAVGLDGVGEHAERRSLGTQHVPDSGEGSVGSVVVLCGITRVSVRLHSQNGKGTYLLAGFLRRDERVWSRA